MQCTAITNYFYRLIHAFVLERDVQGVRDLN